MLWICHAVLLHLRSLPPSRELMELSLSAGRVLPVLQITHYGALHTDGCSQRVPILSGLRLVCVRLPAAERVKEDQRLLMGMQSFPSCCREEEDCAGNSAVLFKSLVFKFMPQVLFKLLFLILMSFLRRQEQDRVLNTSPDHIKRILLGFQAKIYPQFIHQSVIILKALTAEVTIMSLQWDLSRCGIY